MLSGNCEFSDKSELALLAVRFRRREAVESGHKRPVVSEELKRSAVKVLSEVQDSRIGSEEFSVESRVLALSGGQFGREEGQRP